MDTGIWATWYDVDESLVEEHLAWTHAEYLPYMQSQPGIAWAAHYRNTGGGASMQQLHQVANRPDEVVETGSSYIVLVGAPSAHTFFKPYVFDMALPAGFAERLAGRLNVRTEIYTEEARVDGPVSEHRFPGGVPAPAIQFGCYRMKSVADERELARWYVNQRLPMMGAMPGCVRTRKMVSVAGWAKHGVLYEFESLEARLRNHEVPHESKTLDPNAWTGRIASSAIYPPGSPFVGERIWPPVRSA